MLHNILLSLVIKKGESSRVDFTIDVCPSFQPTLSQFFVLYVLGTKENKASASERVMKIHTMHFKMIFTYFQNNSKQPCSSFLLKATLENYHLEFKRLQVAAIPLDYKHQCFHINISLIKNCNLKTQEATNYIFMISTFRRKMTKKFFL